MVKYLVDFVKHDVAGANVNERRPLNGDAMAG
jgi:hypothetical protein